MIRESILIQYALDHVIQNSVLHKIATGKKLEKWNLNFYCNTSFIGSVLYSNCTCNFQSYYNKQLLK